MNIILLKPSEIKDQSVRLSGTRAKHIIKILRAKPGDKVKIGAINGLIGSGIIIEISRRPPYSVLLEITLESQPPPEANIDLLLALPRPIMFKRILSQVTALGVGSFHVTNASRVEKSFWDATLVKDGLYHEHLLKGLEQAVDTTVPRVFFYKGFKPFIETDIAALQSRYKYMLVAHPGVSTKLRDILTGDPGRVLLAIGPEGGWVEFEIKKMIKAGFQPFGLSERILKVDTAATALHSMVSILNC